MFLKETSVPIQQDGFTVKVLGTGCKSCHTQYEHVNSALKQLDVTVEAEYITDIKKITEYGVMNLPAIVINEKVVAKGKVFSTKEVAEIIRKTGGIQL